MGSNVYGVTNWGGTADAGTVFRWDTSNGTYGLVHSFAGAAVEPNETPTLVGSTLYGATYGYNAGSHGTLYRMDPSGAAYTNLRTFSGSDGAGPSGGLTQVGSLLFGVNTIGVNTGNLFSYNIATGAYTGLHEFEGPDGDTPEGGLVQFGSKLYGTTGLGGSSNRGTIFSYDLSTNTFASVHSFSGSDGASPYAGLTVVGSKLYGTTVSGGAANRGTIYSYDPSDNSVNVMHSFRTTTGDGRSCYADLTAVGSDLFGATAFGGTSGRGTVFELNLVTDDYQVLHSFNIADGSEPQYALTPLGGKSYGITTFGGDSDNGVLFSIDIPEASAASALLLMCVQFMCARASRRKRGIINARSATAATPRNCSLGLIHDGWLSSYYERCEGPKSKGECNQERSLRELTTQRWTS